jgi:antitoxin CptB
LSVKDEVSFFERGCCPMTDDIETRRRRAAWRAAHRGTKELDLLIGTYADAKLAQMAEAELGHFESFLALNDPELQDWLLAPEPNAEPRFADLVCAVRQFHGLA